MPEITIKAIEKALDKGFKKQDVFINKAFQSHADHIDQRINSLEDNLKTDIQRVETKVDRALHVEYVNLEVRVKRIEHKLGLKPTSESPQA